VSFGILAVIVLAGLGGPLLGVSGRRFVPVAIGEIVAGTIVGPDGLGVVDTASASVAFLAQIGLRC
jgi:Kef-type K+ transport system membrane component KefB